MSTDIACVKTACIMVRFYDEIQGRIVSRFWELEQVFCENDPTGAEAGATAARLDEAMFTASDGCNVIIGNTNSVKTRLMELCAKCIWHKSIEPEKA